MQQTRRMVAVATLMLIMLSGTTHAQFAGDGGDLIGRLGNDLVINSTAGRVLLNGVDVLGELAAQQQVNNDLLQRLQSLQDQFSQHHQPTQAPSSSPSSAPTDAPTAAPTPGPTSDPSSSPSATPTSNPTTQYVEDCQAILDNNRLATDGVYTIRPARGSGSFQVYCDMEGAVGWTQIGTIQTPSSNNWNTWGGGFWTNNNTIAYPNGHYGGGGRNSDYKNPGWYSLVVGRIRIVSTNSVRHTVVAQNFNTACSRKTMAQIYANHMIASSSWSSCGCLLNRISSSGSWDRVGLAGCSDNSNENTLLSLTAGNGGGYFHNRASCMGQNAWGSFGNCSPDPSYGGAVIFVTQQ